MGQSNSREDSYYRGVRFGPPKAFTFISMILLNLVISLFFDAHRTLALSNDFFALYGVFVSFAKTPQSVMNSDSF